MMRKAISNLVRSDGRNSKPTRPSFTDLPSRRARDIAASGRRNEGVESASKFTSDLVEEPPVGSIRDNFRRA